MPKYRTQKKRQAEATTAALETARINAEKLISYHYFLGVLKQKYPSLKWLNNFDAVQTFKSSSMFTGKFDMDAKDWALEVAYSQTFYFYDQLFTTNSENELDYPDSGVFESWIWQCCFNTDGSNFEELFLTCHGLIQFKIPTRLLLDGKGKEDKSKLTDFKTLFTLFDIKQIDFFFNNNIFK